MKGNRNEATRKVNASSSLSSERGLTMKKKLVSIILTLVMAIAAIPLNTMPVLAATAFPTLSSSAYCEFTATKDIPVYRDKELKTRGTSSPARNSSNAEVWKGDVCKIIEITSNYIKLEYPTSSGTCTGYIKRGSLINASTPVEKVTNQGIGGNTTTYISTGGKTYGYTAKGDAVFKLDTSGNYTLIIYTAKSGKRAYKLGWVLSNEYNSKILDKKPPVVTGLQNPMNGMYNTWGAKTDMSWRIINSSRPAGRQHHVGIDVMGSSSNVLAIGNGKVAYVGNNGANGKFVILEIKLSDGKTVFAFYSHLNSYSVKKGDPVAKGQIVGVAGRTGSSAGNTTHLHFSIVNKLWESGGYWGYASSFTGDKTTYDGVTYYNPVYVIKNNRLP